MRWISRAVTLFAALGVAAILAVVIRARVPDLSVGQSFRVHALFRDGSKLEAGSPVVVAGVRIGDVTGISIAGRFARVDMLLRDDLALPADSFVTRRADSLFGDSYVEIVLGTAGDGAAPARRLAPGDQIANVEEGASTDRTLRAIDRALPRVDDALGTVHELAIRGRQWVQGPLDGALTGAAAWLAEGHVEGPLTRAERALARVEEATAAAATAVATAAPEVDRALGRADRAIAGARGDLVDARVRLAQAMRDVRDGLDAVDPTIAQMAEVMTAIDRGETDDWRGTLGRLASSPALHDTIEDATASVADAARGLDQFRSWLGGRVELGVYARAFRVYATAELRARNDKFYLVELERSGLGVPSDALSDAAGTTQYTRTQVIRDRLRFTAQFGKRLRFLQLRGGIKDSTFGMGGDALLAAGRLRLSADVFGSFQRAPRLKLAAAFAVFRSIHVIAGVDDALSAPGYLRITTGNSPVPAEFQELRYGRDYFVGAAIHFTDADLATLLRVYGAVVAGLL
jgi:phospholipid/cholesterol/gamma-HCH transport system substrate-binding protein